MLRFLGCLGLRFRFRVDRSWLWFRICFLRFWLCFLGRLFRFGSFHLFQRFLFLLHFDLCYRCNILLIILDFFRSILVRNIFLLLFLRLLFLDFWFLLGHLCNLRFQRNIGRFDLLRLARILLTVSLRSTFMFSVFLLLRLPQWLFDD
jgi:hypothetical protein